MRIARYQHEGAVRYGVVEGLEVHELPGHPFLAPGEAVRTTGEVHDLDQVRLLAPVLPSKVIGIGKNYADHAREMGGEPPADPLMFLKPTTTVIGPDEAIVLPPESAEVHYEAELAVVMGRMCRRVTADQALSMVLGYTCANDVSARDFQRSDGQWTRAKGFDTFCPLGPWIETDLDPSDLSIITRRDSEVVQDGTTADMVNGVAALVSYASRAFTLLPGDVILTGTPAGVGPISAGDEVAVTVGGLGTLVNPVR